MRKSYSYLLAPVLTFVAGLTLVSRSLGQTEPAATPPSAAGATADFSAGLAIVDFVRIFNECDQIRDLNETLRKQEVDVQAEARNRQKVIEDKQVEISAFQPGTPDYHQRRKDLIRLGTEANIWIKVAEQDLETQKFDWTRAVYENATQVIGGISGERGLNVVLQYKAFTPDDTDQSLASIRRMIQERAVVFADKRVDITDEVIRRLNKAYREAGGKKQLEDTTVETPAAKP